MVEESCLLVGGYSVAAVLLPKSIIAVYPIIDIILFFAVCPGVEIWAYNVHTIYLH